MCYTNKKRRSNENCQIYLNITLLIHISQGEAIQFVVNTEVCWSRTSVTSSATTIHLVSENMLIHHENFVIPLLYWRFSYGFVHSQNGFSYFFFQLVIDNHGVCGHLECCYRLQYIALNYSATKADRSPVKVIKLQIGWSQ